MEIYFFAGQRRRMREEKAGFQKRICIILAESFPRNVLAKKCLALWHM